ncbi:hypothetical protein TTHERM_00942810 (macronuclear) [Tetrahymena thermophila SB210]|uniref:Zinc finger lsd1 subclass family protein n=1 Tax=Tetrahymena thermophila (strain SB210) TaxID=312017 RepID=Q22DJ9_TETTS|nr:hypothetical protein TTHERM_00942810 [Tetrahymena thermophila SB210]EAR83359.1 hypothetical protein TTHERM_00942810 [Tetrahymena thermophila SB210]|eukprot:XP_001031022.1 hypothetical protein TTHERM_00942810 [Tetrahymena thermophila SB210]
MKASFCKIIFWFVITLLHSEAQNCSKLLQKLVTPKAYQGYQCVFDSNTSLSSEFIVTQVDRYDHFFYNQSLQQQECNSNFLINPNNLDRSQNDARIIFYGKQPISYFQITYGQFYYQHPGVNFQFSIQAFDLPNYYLSELGKPASSLNEQQYCNINNFFRTTQYYFVNLNNVTSQFCIQTYLSPGNAQNKMGDIEILVYFQCPIGCLTCDNSGKCSSCIQNYNLDQKQKYCFLTCSLNKFAQVDQNSTEQVCQLCDPSCSTCSGTSTSCTSCSNNYYTLKTLPSDTNFQCYSTCPDGYYQFSQDCLKCDDSCSTCTGNSLSCTACSNSYYPYKASPSATNFQCYQICPNGSYFLQNQCLQCDASCSICTGSSTNCTTCSSTYYPLKDSPTATNFQCYQTCPNGYYFYFQQCLKCDASCYTCSDSSLSCTVCANNYYPLKTTPSATNFQCYLTCPDGYFLLQQQCQK